jgi:hypothetical protein
MCLHPEAVGGGTLDSGGRTPSCGEERIQPQSRIIGKPFFNLDRNASEAALSEMLVFDHALIPEVFARLGVKEQPR